MHPSTSPPIATPESIEAKIQSVEVQIKASQRTLGDLQAQCRELDLIKAEVARLDAYQAGTVAGMIRGVEMATGTPLSTNAPIAADFGVCAADFAIGSMLGKVAGFYRGLALKEGPAGS